MHLPDKGGVAVSISRSVSRDEMIEAIGVEIVVQLEEKAKETEAVIRFPKGTESYFVSYGEKDPFQS